MNTIESVHVRGFRSLADFRVDDLPNVTVMIGPNRAGKSNFVRFFEMMGWMLMAPRRLARFVRWQGGADDQLFGGHARTARIEASVALRTSAGRADPRRKLDREAGGVEQEGESPIRCLSERRNIVVIADQAHRKPVRLHGRLRGAHARRPAGRAIHRHHRHAHRADRPQHAGTSSATTAASTTSSAQCEPAQCLAPLPVGQEHILAQKNGRDRLADAADALSKVLALAVPHDYALGIRTDIAFMGGPAQFLSIRSTSVVHDERGCLGLLSTS